MRTLLLPALALLTGAASAQEVRVIPVPGVPRASRLTTPGPADCSRGAARALPMPDGAIPVPEVALGGPAPVPMPNHCAEGGPAAGDVVRRLPEVPPVYRFRGGPGLEARPRSRPFRGPEGLDRFRPAPEFEDLFRELDRSREGLEAPGAGAPVAPPDGRE